MHIAVNLDKEEGKRIKDWANKEEIKLPRAYTELLRAGMKAMNI